MWFIYGLSPSWEPIQGGNLDVSVPGQCSFHVIAIFPLGNPQCEFSYIPVECLNKLGNLRLYYHTEAFSFGPLERLYFFHSVTPLPTTNHLPYLLAEETEASGLPPQPALKIKYILLSLFCWITVLCSPNLDSYFLILLLCLDWALLLQFHWLEVYK